MTTKRLHVFALSTGGETAGCLLTVPRACMFADQAPEILEWDYWTWNREDPATAIVIARKAREIQGLDYKTGPAVVCETDGNIRINAMLELLHYEKRMGDATLHFQERDLTNRITDSILRQQEMYGEHPDIKSAIKHALALLRRARESREFALALWPYPSGGTA